MDREGIRAQSTCDQETRSKKTRQTGKESPPERERERERERAASVAGRRAELKPSPQRSRLSFPFLSFHEDPKNTRSRSVQSEKERCHALALEIPCAFNHSAYHLTTALLPLKALLEIFDLASPCLLLLGRLPLFLHPLLLLQEKSRARDRESIHEHSRTDRDRKERGEMLTAFIPQHCTHRAAEREREREMNH